MANAPWFTKEPNIGTASITTVNTSTGTAADGSSNMTTLITANATYGTFVRSIRIAPRGGNAACVVRSWLYDGSNRRLLDATIVPATTASTTTPPSTIDVPVYRQLEPNQRIDVNISAAASPLAAAVDIIGFGSDYAA